MNGLVVRRFNMTQFYDNIIMVYHGYMIMVNMIVVIIWFIFMIVKYMVLMIALPIMNIIYICIYIYIFTILPSITLNINHYFCVISWLINSYSSGVHDSLQTKRIKHGSETATSQTSMMVVIILVNIDDVYKGSNVKNTSEDFFLSTFIKSPNITHFWYQNGHEIQERRERKIPLGFPSHRQTIHDDQWWTSVKRDN